MEGARVRHPNYPTDPFALPLLLPPLPPLPIPTNQAMKPVSTKKKNKIQWLGEDSHRRSTFKKRKKGIMKKAEELHILCGVKTCAIIYGAGENEPDVWPRKDEAARICRAFRLMPELHQMRMMRTHAQFLQEQAGKKAQQLSHQQDEVADAQARCYLYDALLGADLRGLSRECLVRVHGLIQEMLREYYERCTELRGRPWPTPLASKPSPALLPPGDALQAHQRDAISAMRVSTGEVPMEALVNRFLYGEGVEPAQGNGSWAG